MPLIGRVSLTLAQRDPTAGWWNRALNALHVLTQPYIWVGWAAYCASLVLSYVSDPEVTQRWGLLRHGVRRAHRSHRLPHHPGTEDHPVGWRTSSPGGRRDAVPWIDRRGIHRLLHGPPADASALRLAGRPVRRSPGRGGLHCRGLVAQGGLRDPRRPAHPRPPIPRGRGGLSRQHPGFSALACRGRAGLRRVTGATV